jgi:small conductance mechanosensitive channel
MQTNHNILNRIIESTPLTHFWQNASTEVHIAIILALAVLAHFVVKIVRHVSEWTIRKGQAKRNPFGFVTHQPKFITITRLIVSAVTFVIYFIAIGFILMEGFNFALTTYLASASVIGLAVSFGSQGLVQDVVIGVTLIFSDALDVGDMVDLSGTVGVVERIGLRFTKLINFYGQEVFVPNRTIGNVSRFPDGGVYAYADVRVPEKADAVKVRETIQRIACGMWAQFGAIVLEEPVLGKSAAAQNGGWNYLRVRFKIWPGQGALLETTFRQQIVAAMKVFEPNYTDWMVPVIYRATMNLEEAS